MHQPTHRHWIGVKNIFRYLKGTTDLGLFYPYGSSSDSAPSASRVDSCFVGFADAGYLSVRVLKWVMSLPLEAPQSFEGQLNRP